MTGFEHDALRGGVWGGGVRFQARRRIAAEVVARGLLSGEVVHESRTGRDRPGGLAAAGIAWDVNRYATLGLDAGWSS